MSTDKRNTAEAMEAKAAKNIEVVAEPVSKKKQAKSVSYALKAINTHVETLWSAGLLTVEEAGDIRERVKKAAETYIKQEYGIG